MGKLINFWQTSDKYFLIPLLNSFLVALVISGTFLFFYDKLPSQLPLFYSRSWGEAQLASKQQFFLLPTIILLISLINTIFALQLHSIQQLLKRMLLLNLILLDLIIVITAIKIILVFV